MVKLAVVSEREPASSTGQAISNEASKPRSSKGTELGAQGSFSMVARSFQQFEVKVARSGSGQWSFTVERLHGGLAPRSKPRLDLKVTKVKVVRIELSLGGATNWLVSSPDASTI